jgi:hypothetical protein
LILATDDKVKQLGRVVRRAARHKGGVSLSVSDTGDIESALPFIRQAHAASNE